MVILVVLGVGHWWVFGAFRWGRGSERVWRFEGLELSGFMWMISQGLYFRMRSDRRGALMAWTLNFFSSQTSGGLELYV